MSGRTSGSPTTRRTTEAPLRASPTTVSASVAGSAGAGPRRGGGIVGGEAGRDHGVGGRSADRRVVGVPDRADRRRRGQQAEDVRGHAAVGHDECGRGEGVAGAHGQQTRVSGSTADEGDPAGGRRGCCHVFRSHRGVQEAGDGTSRRGPRRLRPVGEQFLGQCAADLLGVLGLSGRGPAHERAVRRGGHRTQRQPFDDMAVVVEVLDDLGERPDRGAAGRTQRAEHGALGGHGHRDALVVQGGAQQVLERRVLRRGTRRPARPGRARAAPGGGRAPR